MPHLSGMMVEDYNSRKAEKPFSFSTFLCRDDGGSQSDYLRCIFGRIKRLRSIKSAVWGIVNVNKHLLQSVKVTKPPMRFRDFNERAIFFSNKQYLSICDLIRSFQNGADKLKTISPS